MKTNAEVDLKNLVKLLIRDGVTVMVVKIVGGLSIRVYGTEGLIAGDNTFTDVKEATKEARELLKEFCLRKNEREEKIAAIIEVIGEL